MKIRHAHPWWRRLRRRLQNLRGAGAAKRHVVHFVEIGGARFKRILFAHASEAARVVDELERLDGANGFPELVFRHQNEVWLRFVSGRPLDPGKDEDADAVLSLYAVLYQASARQVSMSDTPLHRRLLADLDFLVDARLLEPGQRDRLCARGEMLQPDRAWLGTEYIDPVPGNFVITGSGAVAIDVEALVPDQLLGIGPAKMRLRWLDREPAELLVAIEQAGGPDLAAQYDYAELGFLAAYTRQKFIQGKRRLIFPDAFARFLDPA